MCVCIYDIRFVDWDGGLYFVSRASDRINTGGEKVFFLGFFCMMVLWHTHMSRRVCLSLYVCLCLSVSVSVSMSVSVSVSLPLSVCVLLRLSLSLYIHT